MKLNNLWIGMICATLLESFAFAGPKKFPAECAGSLADGIALDVKDSDPVVLYSSAQNTEAMLKTGLPDRLTDEMSARFLQDRWLIFCDNDSMTDKRTCQVINGSTSAGRSTDVKFKLTGTGEITAICVNGHNFPGRVGAVRIGEARAQTTDEAGCINNQKAVKQMLAQLAVGVRIRTRHVIWPDDEYVDDDYHVTSIMLAAMSVGHCFFLR